MVFTETKYLCMKCITCKKDHPTEAFKKVRGGGLGKRCGRCRELVKNNSARFWKDKPTMRKHYGLTTKYGITLEDYAEMNAAQKGCCAICEKETALVVDHCHQSGNLRKLLCNQCNVGLGHFKDNPDLLEAAAAYLREH